ncbi:hypothetical protein ABTX77_27640 [Streptomyces sp. NPDC097704]|uniref:hypothetical protein n=1 Tax=Streptomyces sp. NPDC097704 TaxID=3157101 RepID=UPI00332AE850
MHCGRLDTSRTRPRPGSRVGAVTCDGHALLAGDPTALAPADLTPLADRRVEASDRFLPVLGSAFDRLHARDRLLYVHQVSGAPPRVPRAVPVRRLRPEDGPSGLASSGQAWTAGFRLVREYVHHTTGPVAVSAPSILRTAA